MKKIFLALFLLPIICFAQDHVSEFWMIDKWHTDKVINAQSTEFYLTHLEDWEKNTIYGNSIIFQKDGTFVSKYKSDCGFEGCFPSSKGIFKRIDDNHIHLGIDWFKQHGLRRDCTKIDDHTQRDLGIFKIEPVPNGYKLIKLKHNQ